MTINILKSMIVLTAMLFSGQALAEPDAKFLEWLEGVRMEARTQGISDAILDKSLADTAPIPRIIELDRNQPESTITFTNYINRIVNATRVRIGRAKLDAHREILDQVGQEFGVQPRFIVALWGIETNFGQFTGGFSVVDALATLAYDGRRSAYFRGELMKAFKILEEGHIAPEDMKGSWAGAMGQSQFMPSSFLAYARDHDGDGAKDIWNTQADVFASAANYLKNVGWNDDLTWGREVRLPPGFDASLAALDVVKKIGDWQQLGVRRTDGADLPARTIDASIILPGGQGQPAFMIYDNYRATLRWNRSHYFATAVGLLSDRIAYR
ncbi:MAG: lytic murein transglycosylase [Alphaproteobacteria bacterium]|jgi:membrane-bound lytic murein transglycosylase B